MHLMCFMVHFILAKVTLHSALYSFTTESKKCVTRLGMMMDSIGRPIMYVYVMVMCTDVPLVSDAERKRPQKG